MSTSISVLATSLVIKEFSFAIWRFFAILEAVVVILKIIDKETFARWTICEMGTLVALVYTRLRMLCIKMFNSSWAFSIGVKMDWNFN